jgi:hypothetical protein
MVKRDRGRWIMCGWMDYVWVDGLVGYSKYLVQ